MKILLTGGTGFVGRAVLSELLEAGHLVRLLVRPASMKRMAPAPGVELVAGDVTEGEGLIEAAEDCQAIIHLVGIIRERPSAGITFDRLHYQATLNILAAAGRSGVRRYLHMSALGARPDSASPYHRTKAAAEEVVKSSGLDWTIFRPSIIFGPDDLSINMFADQIRRLPFVPVIGSGQYRLQPVALKTVAQGYARALENPEAIGRRFDVPGPKAYTYDELMRTIALVLGRRVRLIHLPVWPVRLMARLFGTRPGFPITESQLDSLLEGSAADGSSFYLTLGLSAVPLAEGLAEYMKE